MTPMPTVPPQPDPQREALAWFARLRQASAEEGERKAFALWCQNPANARAFAELEARWQQIESSPMRPRPRVIKARRSHLGKLLALTFLLTLAALAYLYWPMAQRFGSELYTDAGERRSVRLADGSTLHLDSASALNIDLRGRTRHLQLVQGQVFLEVMLDGRALEVQVGGTRIQVFGTRLLVARHADHDAVTVFNGKVLLTQGSDQRTVTAGEQVLFTNARLGVVEKADLKAADAWRNGRLVAQDMPLGQVLSRIASYQGLRVLLMNEQMAHHRISGDFNLDQPSVTLETLATTQRLRLTPVLGQWLIVR